VHQAKAPAYDAGAPEERPDFLRGRIRRDVVVLGVPAEHEIAHRAAHHEGGELVLLQRLGDPDCARADPLACYAVLAEGMTLGWRPLNMRREKTLPRILVIMGSVRKLSGVQAARPLAGRIYISGTR